MSADLLARLIEAGTPAALVGEVAMALASAAAAADAQIAAAMQPTKGALRMRRMRERNAASPSVTCDAGDAQVTVSVTEPAPAPSPLPSPCTPNQPHAPTPTREDTPARTREPARSAKAAWPADMPPPPEVSDAQWAGYIAHRGKMRKPLTGRAYDLLVAALAEHSSDEWPPGRIVDEMIQRTWLSFKPEWLHRTSDTRNGQRTYRDRPNQRGGWNPRPGMEGAEPAFLPD